MRQRTRSVFLGVCIGGVMTAGVASVASASSLEYGFCRTVTTGTGAYGNAGCTSLGGERKYEWTVLSEHLPVTIQKKPKSYFALLYVNSLHGYTTLIYCQDERSAAGAYVDEREAHAIVLQFTGCSRQANGPPECASPGAAQGTIVTSALSGVPGVIKKGAGELAANDMDGLALKPETGEVFTEFSCESVAVVIKGSVIGATATNKMSKSPVLLFRDNGGTMQKPEKFESAPREVLIGSVREAAYEPAHLELISLVYSAQKFELRDCKPGC
jgi:hypothetical protein